MTVRGRVVDAEDGSAIPGASVVHRKSNDRKAAGGANRGYTPDAAETDASGRFTLTVPSGPGYLLVEPVDRSYQRSPEFARMKTERPPQIGWRPLPVGLTPIDVPAEGTVRDLVWQ